MKIASKTDRRGLLMAALLGGTLTLLVGIALTFLNVSNPRGEEFRHFAEVILTGLGVIAEVAVAWFIYLELKHSQREELIAATQLLYEQWWSGEMRDHRTTLKWFIDNERKRLVESNNSMKDVPHELPETSGQKGSVVKLVHFFDRVGWLGAAGLIDVDYVLGPMQHVMRRTWMAMSDLILKEREVRSSTDRLDPVYNYGFEWLYLYTTEQGHDQGTLMAKLYSGRKDPKRMSEQIAHDELEFAKYLDKRGGTRCEYGVPQGREKRPTISTPRGGRTNEEAGV